MNIDNIQGILMLFLFLTASLLGIYYIINEED